MDQTREIIGTADKVPDATKLYEQALDIIGHEGIPNKTVYKVLSSVHSFEDLYDKKENDLWIERIYLILMGYPKTVIKKVLGLLKTDFELRAKRGELDNLFGHVKDYFGRKNIN